MRAIEQFVRFADGLSERTGRFMAWATLGSVLVCFTVAVLRYVFRWGSIGMQEAYVWLFGLTFMLGAAYALKHDRHVRVDILYGRLGPRGRAIIDIACTFVFLLPWLFVLGYGATGFVLRSWSLLESSAEPGGLPGVFLLKSAIWLFCLLLGLQALSFVGRRILFLAGRPMPDHDGETPGTAAA